MNANDAGDKWVEINLKVPVMQAEASADFLVGLTGRGIISNDEGAFTRITAYLEAHEATPESISSLQDFARRQRELAGSEEVSLTTDGMPEEDWSAGWKKYFKPRSISKSLVVGPPWEEFALEPKQRAVLIDPGQAFGTGQHETTVLCIRRMEEKAAEEGGLPEMLDVGCGTGILAMAARIFGAPRAVGVDLDPLAVEASIHNAGLNKIDGLDFSDTDLRKIEERFGLVVANITAMDLKALAPALCAHIKTGGELIVSGILLHQADEVREAFEAQNLSFISRQDMGEWSSLAMKA